MSSYRFSPEAECNLLAIWNFSERRWDADQADRYVDGLEAAVLERASGRLLGKSCRALVPECGDELFFRYQSHYVIYRIRGDVLEVLAVFHTSSGQLLEDFFRF